MKALRTTFASSLLVDLVTHVKPVREIVDELDGTKRHKMARITMFAMKENTKDMLMSSPLSPWTREANAHLTSTHPVPK